MNGLTEVPIDTDITDGEDGGDGDEPNVLVQVSICGASGVHWAASGSLAGDPDDELIAATILRAGLAAASLHGSGAWIALQRLCTDYGTDSGQRDVA